MEPTRKKFLAKVLSSPGAKAEENTGPLGIVTLNDPPPTSALVDIVFIHGLGGGSVKSQDMDCFERSQQFLAESLVTKRQCLRQRAISRLRL
ncbi:hypothetical protein N7478_009507 [Penicillium angulare]|uniref:uncharacterized protein n=1 Tax=Penicillium angulare TaxID=116970 RepID=UPI00254093D1|nr:uncharacterized protein N7478_009507 [Penicillium angulare]KAJ5266699.1 hypothetical protein N7478_009507 [Penicillium angulare]